jgi:acetyl esterase/lipase
MYAANSERAKRLLGPPPPGVRVTEMTYTTRDNHQNRAKLFQPEEVPLGGSPLVLMIHGGGFCFGSPEGEEQTCRTFVLGLGATCVAISYRLAPQYPFPYAPQDCWDALKWCAANAKSWNVDMSTGFIVGGSSAGANLAAVLAHRARDEGLSPPLTGQYLAIPLLCPEGKMPDKYTKFWLSREQNHDVPVIPKPALDMFMKAYRPDDGDAVDFAIFNHPNGHGGLPPTFLQVDGLDPLRDEAIIYERVLRDECAVKTRMNVYRGLPHGHWSFFPTLQASLQARRDQLEGVGWLLGRTPAWERVNLGPVAATV